MYTVVLLLNEMTFRGGGVTLDSHITSTMVRGAEHSGPISFLSVFAGYVCLPGAVQSFGRIEIRPRVICKRRVQSGCVCACVQVCACTACLRELLVRLLVRYLRVRRVVRRQSPVACSA